MHEHGSLPFDMASGRVSFTFDLEDQDFITIYGGPQFKFNEAISLYVHCETQDELDRC